VKTFRLLFLSATLLAVSGTANVQGAQPQDVTIQYVHPEKFTDFSIYGRDYQWSASYFAAEISRDLKPLLNRRYPGAKLTLRFADIDLAGRYRTSRRSGRDVRVGRNDIAPARMSFEFLLRDNGGRTLANGSTTISDTSYLSLSNPKRSESLYFEKQMLEKWLKSVQPRQPK
jgi:hypothetical protein